MYYCDECGEVFEEPNEKRVSFEDYYGVSHLFSGNNMTTIYCCPYCGNEPVEEAQKCDMCEEWFNPDDLQDTTEYLNGGCGYCCQNCIADGDMIEI